MHKPTPENLNSKRPILAIALSGTLVLVALINVFQTSWEQWDSRPNMVCDNGDHVFRTAEVNADRVNIRDLPTVFSNVLGQKNQPDPIIVVCEFGVWSRAYLPDLGAETWISSGLITLTPDQPLADRMKATYLILFLSGLAGLLVSIYRPRWISNGIDLLMQTQHLPPHARPLITVHPQQASEPDHYRE